jgi:hypothetical protein
LNAYFVLGTREPPVDTTIFRERESPRQLACGLDVEPVELTSPLSLSAIRRGDECGGGNARSEPATAIWRSALELEEVTTTERLIKRSRLEPTSAE